MTTQLDQTQADAIIMASNFEDQLDGEDWLSEDGFVDGLTDGLSVTVTFDGSVILNAL